MGLTKHGILKHLIESGHWCDALNTLPERFEHKTRRSAGGNGVETGIDCV